MRVLSPEAARAFVGQEIGVSDWKLIDQALIDRFADVTEDHQFIHVDPQAAAATPFGGTIAHGFLTLSLLSRLLPPDLIVMEGFAMGLNYGFEKIRFLEPVRAGKRIRARHQLASFVERGPGQYLTATEVTVEIEESQKPALVATWLGLQITGPRG